MARQIDDLPGDSDEKTEGAEIDKKLDPFDVDKRKFGLQDNENEPQSQYGATQEEADEAKKDLQNTSEFLEATNDDTKGPVEMII